MVAKLTERRRGRGRPEKYPDWLRVKVLEVAATDPKRTVKSIATELGVGYSSAKAWIAEAKENPAPPQKETGQREPLEAAPTSVNEDDTASATPGESAVGGDRT